MVCATSIDSDQPAHTRSLVRAFASRSNTLGLFKLLTEHHLGFLCLKGGCKGSFESALHCWKSHVAAHVSSSVKLCSKTALAHTNHISVQHTWKNHLNHTISSFRLGEYLNPFKPNGISHSYQLDQSISVLKVVEW